MSMEKHLMELDDGVLVMNLAKMVFLVWIIVHQQNLKIVEIIFLK